VNLDGLDAHLQDPRRSNKIGSPQFCDGKPERLENDEETFGIGLRRLHEHDDIAGEARGPNASLSRISTPDDPERVHAISTRVTPGTESNP